MIDSDVRTTRFRRSMTFGHDALLWKLDGLSERDLRMPMTPTGTSLLGLVKHVASVETEYFGFVVNRPFPDPPSWLEGDPDDSDLWAAADESAAFILDFARRAFAHTDETLAILPLDTPGNVPWWGPEAGEVTLERVAVHMLVELNRHLGHADIVRELTDGAAGLRADVSNMPERDPGAWSDHVSMLRALAEAAPSDVSTAPRSP